MGLYVVTGGAGFIGSNLVRTLLDDHHEVRVVDDFSTGRRENLDGVVEQFELFEGSICDTSVLERAFAGADYCLHLAAIPSVPRSLNDPIGSNRANVEGSLAVYLAARDAGLKRVVAASSSSVYGSNVDTPTVEANPLAPISPYAVSKAAAEMYARVCDDLFGVDIVSLRYFNVFGPRQDPNSTYAAVIPRFIRKLMEGEPGEIHGDGLQSRDFTFVDNVVRANLLACEAEGPIGGAYNIACGSSTSVLDLYKTLGEILGVDVPPSHVDGRPGDIRRSYADIGFAERTFGYTPQVSIGEGLERTVAWYGEQAAA